MSRLEFQSFRPDLDPATIIMIDGYAPGFRMISHWPGHGTAEQLRHRRGRSRAAESASEL